MAVWYFGALFSILFSTFYFIYGADRIGSDRDNVAAAAEIFAMCHRAATTQARSNAALGAGAAAPLNCNNVSLPTASTGLRVTGILITVNPATDVGLATGRVIVTYLNAGQFLNGIPFETVQAQLGQRYQGDPVVGIVQTVAGQQAINTVPTIVARVPATIATGTLAMVTTIQP